MVELMLGVLSDALLVLYQTEVFKTEKPTCNHIPTRLVKPIFHRIFRTNTTAKQEKRA